MARSKLAGKLGEATVWGAGFAAGYALLEVGTKRLFGGGVQPNPGLQCPGCRAGIVGMKANPGTCPRCGTLVAVVRKEAGGARNPSKGNLAPWDPGPPARSRFGMALARLLPVGKRVTMPLGQKGRIETTTRARDEEAVIVRFDDGNAMRISGSALLTKGQKARLRVL